MNALRLALTELRRLTTSTLGKAAIAAMVLVPSIYGGFYLYANKDPYAAMSRVPAAVVVEDSGTTLSTGERLDVGHQVATTLVDSHSFGWHQVDRGRADQGLRGGDYNFVLVVPRTFSADLASSAEFTPRQALLEIETNDANGYLSRTIANQVVAQVTKSVAAQVSSTAANQLLTGFSTIHDKVADAAKGAGDLATGAQTASKGAHDLATGASSLAAGEKQLVAGTDQLASGSAQLSTGLQSLKSQTASLPSQTRTLADGAKQVSDGNAKIAAAGQKVASASSAFVAQMTTARGDLATRLAAAGFTDAQVATVLAEADRLAQPVTAANGTIQSTAGQLTDLSTGAARVAAGASTLADASTRLTGGIAQAAAGGAQLASGAQDLKAGQQTAYDGATQLAAGAAKLDSGLGDLATGAAKLRDGLSAGLRSIPDPSADQRKAVAQTLGNPVGVKGLSQAAAADYGAGLAPFFMSLALWIGGFVLFTRIRPMSNRAIVAGQPAWRIALGGWLAPAVLGLVQGVLAYLVVIVGVGVRTEHPILLLLFMFAISVTFMAIIHALMSRFGMVGQFLGLVVMVLQLVSAGGTFPWQTLPAPLHPLHHLLPMSYAVDGIRRLMYGGSLAHLSVDLAVLAAYAVGALALGTVAARRLGTWDALRVKPEVVAP